MLHYLTIPLIIAALSNPILVKESELDTLAAKAGTEVTLRGFVIENENGQWAVSSHPPVKSCCRGKIAQQGVWVPIDETWEAVSPEQVVEFRGILTQTNDNNNFQSFHLSSPSLIPREKRQNWPWIPLGGALAVSIAGIFYWRNRR